MKSKILFFIVSIVSSFSLNAQDKEWFGSVPGDPSLNFTHRLNSSSYQTQNYLCWQSNNNINNLYLFNGNSWRTLKIDSLKYYLSSMDEQNDSVIILPYDYYSTVQYVWLHNGIQWEKISKLKFNKVNGYNCISSIKFYRNKIYAFLINNKFNTSLIEYDFKTNSIKTVTTFQQKALNEVSYDFDKMEMSVRNSRLYISGAYDSVNHQASQGYGYYDGSSFKSLNIFPTSPINYSLVKQLDKNLFVVERFYSVTTNYISSNRIFLMRNDSIISDITNDLHTRYFKQTGLAYSRHQYFQVYLQNGFIHVFTQVVGQHYVFDPESRRWHQEKDLFWDGFSFFFKNNRYVFNSSASLPYTTPSIACFILKPKPYVSGFAFADLDDNCSRNINDVLVPKQWIKVVGSNNTTATLSRNNGYYEFPLEPDTYTYSPYESAYSTSICSSGTLKVDSFTQYNRDVSHNFIAPYKNTGDIKVDMHGSVLRRGANYSLTITIDNLGKPDLTVTPRLNFDHRLQFVSTSMAYLFKDHHSIVFDNVKVNKFNPIKIDLMFYLPPDSLVTGNSIRFVASADSSNTEVSYANNIKIHKETVMGPYDPNHITANVEGIVKGSPKPINYTVEFQNLGTDTAFNVTIVDTIPSKFDVYSIKLLSASSNNISATIKGAVVSFKLNQVRLTPKTFDEAKSKGFISFSIELKDTLKIGEQVKNKAGIYFDYEDEVVTNQSNVERVKNSASVQSSELMNNIPFAAYPNPSTNHLSLQTYDGKNIESVKFFSMTGQELFAESSNGIDFDISSWPNGLFLVVVKIDGQTYTVMNSKLVH